LFIHGFGGTETGPVLLYFIDKETQFTGNNVPLGYGVEDTEVLLLDANAEEVGNDRIGEIVVKSRYLALGYWRQPELTRVVFRPDPSGGDVRLYHTGDLGRRLPDGTLEHLGRKDWQLKIRGHRIEVAEVESALLDIPAVAEAVVMPWEFQEKDTRLVAYFVLAQDATVTVNEVRRLLQAKLPEYMVPSAFVPLDTLPLTPNGKADRRALPTPDWSRSALENAFVVPRTPWGVLLAETWQCVLEADRVGVYDNFFDLGGHSLGSMWVIDRVAKHTGLRLHPSDLKYQTLGQLAAACEAHMPLPSKPMNFLQKIWHALQGRL